MKTKGENAVITNNLELLGIGRDLLSLIHRQVRHGESRRTVELFESLTASAEKIISVAHELLLDEEKEIISDIREKPDFQKNERIADARYYSFNREAGVYERVKPKS